jgi:hypothetical protein
MKKLNEIISKELFLNAFYICQKYSEEDFILDINFRLLKKTFEGLNERTVSSYYDKFIESDLVYSLPELFSTDIVLVPKNITNIREYRFFSAFSMILYNAVGLLFVDCCSEIVNNIDFSKKNIFSYYPTKFVLSSDKEKFKWRATNDYKTEYKNFSRKLKEIIQPGNVILKIDIAQYFGSIDHDRLIELLKFFSPEASLKRNGYDSESGAILEFYFESLLGKKYSIPQGRKNFVSDYLGYLYLVPFDINIEYLAISNIINFKGAVRYVDDVYIIFEMKDGDDLKRVYKELLNIETKIVKWIKGNLGLDVSFGKTERRIIDSESAKNKFIKITKKAISSPDRLKEIKDNGPDREITRAVDITECMDKFIEVLSKFKFDGLKELKLNITKENVEDLKVIFDKKFQNFVLSRKNRGKLRDIIKDVDLELTTEYINILILLFLLESKDKSQPFAQGLSEFINKKINFEDKRHIHIILIVLAQRKIKTLLLKKAIRKNSTALLSDDYGKYLALFFGLTTSPNNIDEIFQKGSYHRICNEYQGSKLKKGKFIYDYDNDYIFLVQHVLDNLKDKESLVRQLKYYSYYRMNKRWDLSFSHLHNFFHEICKIIFKLNDKATVDKILKRIKKINLHDELIIRKFYIRRNFNLITHPSQKGVPSIKVSRKDFYDYENKIIPILKKY